MRSIFVPGEIDADAIAPWSTHRDERPPVNAHRAGKRNAHRVHREIVRVEELLGRVVGRKGEEFGPLGNLIRIGISIIRLGGNGDLAVEFGHEVLLVEEWLV